MEKTDLINKCIKKDAFAWNKFVERYSRLVYWAIKSRLKRWNYLFQDQDIDEIHQNVFLLLWKHDKLKQLKNANCIEAWLVAVSGNETVNYLRHIRGQLPPKAETVLRQACDKNKIARFADLFCAKGHTPSDHAQTNELYALARKMMEELAPRQKIMLKLNLLYGKKYTEIAKILNVPTGSVSSTIKRAKADLKYRLNEKIKDF